MKPVNRYLPIHYALPTLLLLLYTGKLRAQEAEAPKPKPVSLTGMVDVRGIGYAVKGIAARRSPFSYIISGSMTASVYNNLSIPISFSISEQDRNVSQSFNQFGISPTYKWITVHLGYRNVNFSPYTLAGYTMLGAGAELTPGKFRFGFMYGRLNRATNIDTATGVVRPYSFSRKGYAVKLGYGTDERMVELSFISAKDDSNSVRRDIPDTLRTVTPAANVVIGIRSVYTFAKKLFVEIDGAASGYTYNTGSRLDTSEDTRKVNGYTKGILPVNASTQLNLAYTGSIGYKEKNWTIKCSYRHIDPEFQSMGAYFFNNDIESYMLAAALNTFRNRLRFNGSIGLQQDNLRKQKTSTTQRVIGNVNISYDMTDRLGIDANYINFSANGTPSVVSVQNKYLLAQTTHNISVTPRYIKASAKYTHVVLLSYNYNTLVDVNAATRAFNNIKTSVIFLTYSLTINKNALTITTGLNEVNNRFYGGVMNSYGLMAGLSKNLLKNKLLLSTTNSFSRTDQSGGASVLNAGLSGGYNAGRHHRFSIRYGMINNIPDKPDPIVSPSFTEHTAEAGYTYNF